MIELLTEVEQAIAEIEQLIENIGDVNWLTRLHSYREPNRIFYSYINNPQVIKSLIRLFNEEGDRDCILALFFKIKNIHNFELFAHEWFNSLDSYQADLKYELISPYLNKANYFPKTIYSKLSEQQAKYIVSYLIDNELTDRLISVINIYFACLFDSNWNNSTKAYCYLQDNNIEIPENLKEKFTQTT